jgi:hypothetical protein
MRGTMGARTPSSCKTDTNSICCTVHHVQVCTQSTKAHPKACTQGGPHVRKQVLQQRTVILMAAIIDRCVYLLLQQLMICGCWGIVSDIQGTLIKWVPNNKNKLQMLMWYSGSDELYIS